MKPASCHGTLAVRLLGFTLLGAPVGAQEVCPRASGPDAESGWVAYGANDMDGARARFTAALDRCDNDHYARTGLGYVLLRGGSVDEAASLWTVVVASEPNNVDALTGLGLVAWRSGDPDAVERYFGRVVLLVPDHPTALEYLARVSGTAGPSTPLDLADEAWVSGNTALAAELYRDRLADDPADGLAALRVALVAAWAGQYDAAMGLLDDLIEREPGHFDARLARARVRAWSGDVPAAQAEVLDLLSVQPDNPEALEALALFQSWAGDTEGALGSYDALIAIAPQSDAAGRQRAQALAWASRFEASRSAYDLLLERNPGDNEARLGLAQTLAYTQDFDAAIAEYDRVLDGSPREMRALVGKAKTLGWAGRLVEAEGVAMEAIGIDGGSAEAWSGLGQLFLWQGRNAAAKEAFETAARLAPTNAGVQDQLRSLNLTFAPLARPRVVYERDSDRNRMLTTSLTGSWHLVPRLEVQARAYYKDLEQGVFARTAQGVTVSGGYQLRPGWVLSLGIGGSRSNATNGASLFEYQAGVRTPERYPYGAALNLSSTGMNETAALAELGGRSTEVLVTGRWTPALGWRVDGSVGLGKVAGREDNGRRSASLSTSKRLGRFFSLGTSFRSFSFEKNLDDGYFDPDFYGVAEITSYWLYRPGPWTVLVELAPGVQKVRSDGDAGSSLRSNTRVAYRVAPGREIFLSFGYSSAGLVSFATGASGYRYTAFILGSSWVF